MNKLIRLYRAETAVTLLTAVTLFSVLLLAFGQWHNRQQQRNAESYQRQQALQLAENQIALLMAGRNCEHQQRQNGLTFHIRCSSGEIRIDYPLGQLRVSAENGTKNPRKP